jgi:hypothetical protein
MYQTNGTPPRPFPTASFTYRPPRIRIPRLHRALQQLDDDSSSDESLETPQARLRRLKFEMDELERDLKSSRGDEEKLDSEGLMKQLEVLKSGMGGLEVEVEQSKEREIDRSGELMRKLEGVGIRKENEELNNGGQVEHVDVKSDNVDDLDKRLAMLESVIGAGGVFDEVRSGLSSRATIASSHSPLHVYSSRFTAINLSYPPSPSLNN